MNYNVRIDDNFLRGDHVDGEVLQHTDLNELENVAKTAINANYEDIQKLQDGTITIGNSEKLDGATLSKFATETLQNSDTKVPTSSQVKNYVDGAIGNIDLDGYYTKRETDTILEGYVTPTDYATAQKGGVIKLGQYGATRDANGFISLNSYSDTDYESLTNNFFISKGTLENVITGKDLTTKSYVDGELDEKVDKVEGKQLSTEDYTTAEKSKLSGIETGAQVNKIETIKVNGTSQVISSKSIDIPVPTKTSDLTNDSDYVKNTDYATPTKGGTIKASSDLGISVASNGILGATTKNYATYSSAYGDLIIGKGTLENVITGKGLATKEDLPIKVYKDLTQANALNFNTIDAGLYYTDNCYVTIGEDTHLEKDLKLWCVEEYSVADVRNVYDFTWGIEYSIDKDGDVYTRRYRQFVYDDMLDYSLSFYYTKNEINYMIGDIADALDAINGESVGD